VEYDFDGEVNRQGTSCVKWEFVVDDENPQKLKYTGECFGENRLLPLWVADMDFPCPEPVIKALADRVEKGIYGYTLPTEPYYSSVINWMKKRQGWEIAPEWICLSPGVVPAINLLVRTFISPGDSVLIQPPVYHPFFSAIENNKGGIAANPLLFENGRYHMDIHDLEAKARDPKVKMAILCSPHNPVGRVWTPEELVRFGEICLENDVLIVSDEIHGDLIYKGNTFTPFASLNEDFAKNSVTCTAPSKTFNMAGLQTSNIIIPDETLRIKFTQSLASNGLFTLNTFGIVALQAAYDNGEEWLDQVMDYIEVNLVYLQEFVAEKIPQISVVEPEGTYLVWLDCRNLGMEKQELRRLFFKDARVYLDDGIMFGPEGEGFQRINIACPRPILVEALGRIENAINQKNHLQNAL
jgi:cysteine-S-conjugate beta-lyase